MKKIYLLIAFCMVCVLGYGQTASSYAYSRLSGAFNSLVGTGADSITIHGIISDDSATLDIPIGFTFNFCGVNYTTCAGNANGVLALSDTIASADISTSAIRAGWLMPLWEDLYGFGGTAYYQTTGTVGSRVFTLEWHNWTENGHYTDIANFQVKLYEGTNVIQFVYGNTASLDPEAAIGIANSDTDIQTLPNTAATTTNTSLNAACTQPDSGTILQWCPPLTVTSIIGTASVCAGSATALSDTTSGGVWSSDNASVATVAPTGGALGVVFGIASGTTTISYTISDACTSLAATSFVTVNPLPLVDTMTMTGIRSYCAGTGGLHTGLNGSSLGIRYQLYLNDTTAIGAPVAGTGSPLDFGADTAAGSYTVVATDTTTGCSSNMYGVDTISIIPLPTAYTLTGGSYCMDGTGAHIRLSGSAEGVSYQLYNHLGAVVDTPVSGTGAALDFGLYAVADSYTVIASDITTNCVSTMADTAVIVINPLPTVYSVFGGGSYCESRPGLPVSLNGSDTGIRYQLYYHDTTLIGTALSGTGDSLHFGLDTGAGGYTVVATHTATGCMSHMEDSALIVVIPFVVPSVTINSSIVDTICEGSEVTFTAMHVHGGGEPHFQWSVNDTVVGFGYSYSYTPANGNLVSVRLISDAVCAIPDTVRDSIHVTVHPHQTPAVTLSVAPNDTVCRGTEVTITATPAFGGNSPEYTWVKNTHVVAASDSTYTYMPSNGDDVYAVMNSNYFCRSFTTAYSNVIAMTVEEAIVPSLSIVTHPGTLVGTGKNDTLIAVVTNGGAHPNFQWYLNGAAIGGATSAVFTGLFVNKDSVSCIVTRGDACNLPGFSSVVIYVGNLDVKQTISSGSGVDLVPNPNKGTFTITGTLGNGATTAVNEEVSIEITNMLGQVVYKNQTISQNGIINQQVQMNNTLASGVYILNLHSGSGNNAIRFVIEQ